MRKIWTQTHIFFLTGDVDIDVKLASKDLGCMLQYSKYSKRTFLGCLKDRKRRLFRLQKTDLSLQDKASKIQTSVWPLAFYGAESQVGESHFVQLRRMATDASIGKRKYASPSLPCHISPIGSWIHRCTFLFLAYVPSDNFFIPTPSKYSLDGGS